MTYLVFASLLFAGSVGAGLLGALTGLGGGVILIPLLVLVFGVDVRYAIGASLVSVMATSSGAAAAYVSRGFTNLRVGMLLQVAAVGGAVVGASLSGLLSPGLLSLLFAGVLAWSGVQMARRKEDGDAPVVTDALAARLRLSGSYPEANGPRSYGVRRAPLGLAIMALAGALSGLLGIGSGVVKVLAMDQAMGLPYKVSAATSNFMIGMTAAASAGIYLARGNIDALLVMPVVLGVLAGATFGAHILVAVQGRILRIVFAIVILLTAMQMVWQGLTRMGDAG